MSGPSDFTETYVTRQTLDHQLEKWMSAVAPYQFRQTPPLAAGCSALLVVDMTKPFVDEGQPLNTPAARAILPRVQQLVDAYRQADRPVIWLVQGHHSIEHDRGQLLNQWWPSPIYEGTEDVAMADELDVLAGEKVIIKRRYSGFYQTDLDLTLRSLGAANVTVAGVLTNICPFSTAMDAFMRGYRVYYPADATGAHNESLHVNALCTVAGWFGHVVRSSEIRQWLFEKSQLAEQQE